MVILDDKLYLKSSDVEPKGTLRIRKVNEMRTVEGKFGPYTVLDIVVLAENGNEYKFSLYEKDRALLIPKLGRDTAKWIDAILVYKVITKVVKGVESEQFKIESATPFVTEEKVG